VGRLWRGHVGRELAERKKEKRGGVRVLSSSSPPFLMARVGAEGAGLDRGVVQEHGYRHEMNGSSDLHSKINFFLIFVCQVFDEMPARNSD
jgi:hypothetical protein